MAYSKQTWQDNVSVLSAARFNHMEDGIYDGVKSLRIPGITVETGVAHGDFIYPAVENDQEIWKTDDSVDQTSGRFICGPVDGNTADAVRAGIMPMPAALIAALTQAEIDARYSLYIQSGGNLGLGVTSIHAGFILSASEMAVDFYPVNQNPKAYTENMVQFFAMPGPSGTVRLKIEKPSAADGVKIYRSTSAYDDSGVGNWGTLVADITDDSGYMAAFEWFEDDDGGSNLSDGTVYYYKAFPYVGTIHNETAGDNELYCRAGLLLNEWIPTDLSGSSLPDNVGGNNGTVTSITLNSASGIIGDALSGSSGYVTLGSNIDLAAKTIAVWAKPNTANTGLWGNSGGQAFLYGRATSANNFRVGGRADYLEMAHGTTAWALVGSYYGTSGTPVTGYLNGASQGSHAVTSIANSQINRLLYAWPFEVGLTYELFFSTLSDVIRVFYGDLSSNEWTMLYNGGAGC